MNSEAQDSALIEEAKDYLYSLSKQKLQVAVDFLAYLQQKEEEEATQELLSISNFEQELQAAEAEVKAGEVVSWQDIRRNV